MSKVVYQIGETSEKAISSYTHKEYDKITVYHTLSFIPGDKLIVGEDCEGNVTLTFVEENLTSIAHFLRYIIDEWVIDGASVILSDKDEDD
jgi:hypothetical protein